MGKYEEKTGPDIAKPTSIEWDVEGIWIFQPDEERTFTPAEAEAFGQAIIAAAADAREAGATDGEL